MKIRLCFALSNQFWFIILMTGLGGGLIYFLNSIGVIEAMRNDNTLDYLYESNLKLPKAPAKSNSQTTSIPSNPENLGNRVPLFHKESDANVFKTGSKPVPKIIHQFWDSPDIPIVFIENIRSWLRFHPKWEYWFWTQKAFECFLRTVYQFKDVKSLSKVIISGNLSQYFIVRIYGGLYIDLDIKCLKSLDALLNTHCCVFLGVSHITDLNFYSLNTSSIDSSFIACKSHHQLLNLFTSTFSDEHELISNNTEFFINVFERYRSNYNVNSESCQLTVLPKYEHNIDNFHDPSCSVRNFTKLNQAQQRECASEIHNDRLKSLDRAYFTQSWGTPSVVNFQFDKTENIYKIFPNAKNVESELCD